ncbi:MAG: endonuclease/exonuclease/phosphatase family protein [Robiginitalea sp.]|nr:endonuclease/exonuclease/phosphatase family protein [Robiginitalea sp.]
MRILLLVFLSTLYFQALAQQKGYQVRTVAFYNLENLFDTHNDSLTQDDDRTPDGSDRWSDTRLKRKLKNLTRVLSEIGGEAKANPPDIIGVCEVENREVLESLIEEAALRRFDYGIIHRDSPDHRGIDVALLYRKGRFFALEVQSFRLILHDAEGKRKYTRDQLVVSGLLDQEEIHLLVNHWPSRAGAALQSRTYRKEAALRQRFLVDSILYRKPGAKIISMGDFNDNPNDPSMRILSRGRSSEESLYNPMEKLFKKGTGSLAYRDRWNLFDQMLFSRSWIHPSDGSYRLWRARVFQPAYLKTREGRYRGYPFRTYAGGRYQGGYSDHFPVYAFLIKQGGKD